MIEAMHFILLSLGGSLERLRSRGSTLPKIPNSMVGARSNMKEIEYQLNTGVELDRFETGPYDVRGFYIFDKEAVETWFIPTVAAVEFKENKIHCSNPHGHLRLKLGKPHDS